MVTVKEFMIPKNLFPRITEIVLDAAIINMWGFMTVERNLRCSANSISSRCLWLRSNVSNQRNLSGVPNYPYNSNIESVCDLTFGLWNRWEKGLIVRWLKNVSKSVYALGSSKSEGSHTAYGGSKPLHLHSQPRDPAASAMAFFPVLKSCWWSRFRNRAHVLHMPDYVWMNTVNSSHRSMICKCHSMQSGSELGHCKDCWSFGGSCRRCSWYPQLHGTI